MVDLFFNCVVYQEPVNGHFPLLADPESAICSLDVYHWVPVGVENDYLVGGFEVDAETSYFGGEEEDEDVWRVVEAVDDGLPLRNRHIAINSPINPPLLLDQTLQHIQYLLSLTKNQNFIPFLGLLRPLA